MNVHVGKNITSLSKPLDSFARRALIVNGVSGPCHCRISGLSGLLIGLFCLVNASAAVGAPAQNVTIDTVFAAWKKRQNRVRTFEFAWHEKHFFAKGAMGEPSKKGPNKFNPDNSNLPAQDSVFDSTFHLIIDGAKVRAEFEEPMVSGGRPRKLGLQKSTWILMKGLMKTFSPKQTTEYPGGLISKGTQYDTGITKAAFMPVIMAYRPFRYHKRYFADFRRRYEIVPGDYTVSGRPCVLIKLIVDRPGRSSTLVWLDKEREYLPLRFVRQSSTGKPSRQIDFLKWRQAAAEWVLTNWKIVYLKSDGSIRASVKAAVGTHRLNQKIPPSNFTLEFPVGTWVYDSLKGEKYIVRPNGKRRIITRAELIAGAGYEQFLNTETGMALSYRPPNSTWLWIAIGASVLLALTLLMLWRWKVRARAAQKSS